MARKCEICGKAIQGGNRVSHAHNITKRRWLPNLQRVRVVQGGRTLQIRVCTRCLRSDKVRKHASKGKAASTA
ncbi:MAG TPA: 50S ribosomal protein L28 [Candidatus Saccharimonadales bacterium]|nr:50S ribosomal protein L28 [Candidatus Saccharimonadales bacterium]